MTDLNQIITTFTQENKKKFINYLHKKNKRTDTKNIALFQYLNNSTLNSKAICIKLYGTEKQNAYHALRKRLYQSIIDFTANTSLHDESSINMQIIKYILAAKSFIQQKQFKVAYKILDKAEKVANEHTLFSLLNDIYQIQIQYAYSLPNLALKPLILQFKNNQEKLQKEAALNIVYAKVREALNRATYHGKIIDFKAIIDKNLKEQFSSTTNTLSFKSLYQLVSLASFSVFITKDYIKIEPYLISTYKSIINHKNKDKQLFYHIQILHTIANTLFRNKKFKESLQYLKSMHHYMHLKQGKHYNTFSLKYHLLLALNLNYNNKPQIAIKTLQPLIIKKHPDLESWLDIQLALLVFYFQQSKFKKARHILISFFHTDNWYTEKAGKEWVIKKNLIEILLYIELKNTDLVDSKLLSFKRIYYPYLKSINQTRVTTYLDFVNTYYKTPENITSLHFKNKVEKNFIWLETYKEDIFVISFYSWLKGKMTKTDTFAVTLQLINKAEKQLSQKQ